MPKSLWLYLVILFAFLIAHDAVQPPPALGLQAPPTVFSAGRAMADVAVIARAPHPTGSAEAGVVRAYLMQRMGALGLNPEIHTGQGVEEGGWRGPGFAAAGAVQNLVGGIRGKDPALPAVLVMSHYDTVRNSPGAADDTAGVAASLEIARMIEARGQPQRDVLFLFTDGEEAGLLGAQAFFANDPLVSRIGAVINMEARGDSGLAPMFEAGPGSQGLIGLYGAEMRRPSATSMAAFLYSHMPNGTDFTHAIEKKLPGLNFAFVDDQLAYHTPLATPDHLNPASLQHLGEGAGASAAALAFRRDMPGAGTDLVYSDALSRVLIAYPAPLGFGLLGAGLFLTLLALWRGGVSRKIAFGAMAAETARGGALILALAAAAALFFHLVGRLYHLDDYARAYAALVHGEALMSAFVLASAGLIAALAGGAAGAKGRGLVAGAAVAGALLSCLLARSLDMTALALGAVVVVTSQAALFRAVRIWGLWGGALALTGLLGLALQISAPGLSPLFVWPFLAGSVAAAVVALLGRGDPSRSPGLWLSALVVFGPLAQVLAWAAFVFTAVGVNIPEANAILLLAAAPLIAPLAWAAGRGPVGRFLALLFLILAVGFSLVPLIGPNGRRPGLTQAFYVSDPDAKVFAFVSELPLDAWSRSALALDGGKAAAGVDPPLLWGPAQMAAAHPRPLPQPVVGLRIIEGRLIVQAAPVMGGESLILYIRPDHDLGHASLNGKPLHLAVKAGEWGQVAFEAPPPEGVALALDASAHGRVDLVAAEVRSGWPQGVTPSAKPADRMGWNGSDTTWSVRRASASW